MGAREAAWTTPRRAAALAAAAALAIALGACGEDDFENEPRPPAPVEVTANVTDERVLISPDELGAGLAVFTVSNQSPDPVELELVGPAPTGNESTAEIPPGGVGSLKAELVEGDYELAARGTGSARSAQLTVGPQRQSSQNELLLP